MGASVRRHPRSVKGREYHEVLSGILGSNDEYCLILRPFGYDGRTRLSYGYRPWLAPRALWFNRYLEQAVVRSARKSCGLTTYALVDSRSELAPPGPVPVRASMDRWQFCTGELIDNAHSVVIVLPPDQEFRDGFKWEVSQLSVRCMQKRSMIVIPPLPRESAKYQACAEQAAMILATFETFAGEVDEIDPLLVLHWERELMQLHTLVVEIEADGLLDPATTFSVHLWYPTRRASPGRVGARFYESSLAGIFSRIDRELKKVPFERRYPRARKHLSE
jgi:hypothetical protein